MGKVLVFVDEETITKEELSESLNEITEEERMNRLRKVSEEGEADG